MTNVKRKQFQDFKKRNVGKFYFFENFSLTLQKPKSLGARLREAMARKKDWRFPVLLHFKRNYVNVYYLEQGNQRKIPDYNQFYRQIVDVIIAQSKVPIRIEQLLTLPTEKSRELIKELIAPHQKFIKISSD